MSVKDNDRLDDLAKTLDRVARELQTLRAENESREALTEGLTVRELADRVGLTEDVVLEFAQAAGEILGERPMSPQVARRAALLAAAEQVWEGELGPLLTSRQVRGLLGNVSRQRVDELLRARRLIGLRDSGGSRRFPAFQFEDGRPSLPLIEAFWIVADATASEWTAASWCATNDDALDGHSPVQWLRSAGSTDRLMAVARQDAARLSR